MNSEIEKIIDFFHYMEGMKRELRNLWLSNGRQEDDADHSWRLAMMAMIVAPKLSRPINVEKMIKMALIHDIVEIDAKDTPVYKHFNNAEAKKTKKENEEKAIHHILEMLGEPSGKEIFDLWQEYESQEVFEAQVVQALDKLESRFQFLEDNSKKYGTEETSVFPAIMKRITELCNIDPLLVDLDQATLEAGSRKVKEMKASGRIGQN